MESAASFVVQTMVAPLAVIAVTVTPERVGGVVSEVAVVHADTFKRQLTLHEIVPPRNPRETQVAPPRSVPSHCSPVSRTPFPHTETGTYLNTTFVTCPWETVIDTLHDALLQVGVSVNELTAHSEPP